MDWGDKSSRKDGENVGTGVIKAHVRTGGMCGLGF